MAGDTALAKSTAPQSGSNENVPKGREKDRTNRLPERVTEAGARRSCRHV